MGADGKRKNGEPIPPATLAAIPALYARTGNKAEVARQLGISDQSVARHLEQLSGEEWERIQEMQLKEIVRGSAEIILACLAKIGSADAIKSMSAREAIGAYKIMAEQVRAWGMGAKAQAAQDDLSAFLAEAELKRRQAAIEQALATGDVEVLREFAPREKVRV